MLEDALHGLNSRRAYLQPWRELEERICNAVHFLSENKSEEAHQECKSAFAIAMSIVHELEKLRKLVDDAGSFREYILRYRPINQQFPNDDEVRAAICDGAM
jgi:hypothetical protein